MENQYRIALVRTSKNAELKYYICRNKNIVKGDYVLVEGSESIHFIEDIITYEVDKLPCPYFILKNVYKKLDLEKDPKFLEQYNKQEQEEIDEVATGKQKDKNKTEYIEHDYYINYAIKEMVDEEIKIDADVRTEFSYADYHTDAKYRVFNNGLISNFAFMSFVELENTSNLMHDNLSLEITFANDSFKMHSVNIKKIQPLEKMEIKLPLLSVDVTKLYEINEMIPCSVNFLLKDLDDNEILGEQEYNFVILPISQPSLFTIDNDKIYAKYITPNAPKVKQVALDANKINGTNIVAYQNGSYQNKIDEIKTIYDALHNYGIVYQNPPAVGLAIQRDKDKSFSTQRVRMPEEVLTDRKGTCLDLSILLCAVLEEVGYHSIMILIRGHAFVGVFLNEEDNFIAEQLIQKNITKVYNAATSSIPSILLIQATSYCSDDFVPFKDAVISGINQIKFYDGSFSAIDIHNCHRKEFSPIPIDANSDDLKLNISISDTQNSGDYKLKENHILDLKKVEHKYDKFTYWENKLSDLNENNPLINFDYSSDNLVRLLSNHKVYDIMEKDNNFTMWPLSTDYKDFAMEVFEDDYNTPYDLGYTEEVIDDYVYSFEYESTLDNLIKQSEIAMDEVGVSTLYLCLGRLNYVRSGRSKGTAPFLMIPISVKYNKTNHLYSVNYDYDDRKINQSFFDYYKLINPNSDYSAFYNIKSEYRYLDVVETFKKYCKDDIRLDENFFFICNLRFSHNIMLLDMRKNKEQYKNNFIIKNLIEQKDYAINNKLISNSNIDEIEKYKNFAAPFDYDSTQLKAILDANDGKSLILDGGPGTGKSQTIANIIVNAIYNNKTVLFVSEKQAALDAVYNRLDSVSLGDYCLELYSNKTSREDLQTKLKKVINLEKQSSISEELNNNCLDIVENRTNILNIINKIHNKTYFMSLYDAISNNEKLNNIDQYIKLDYELLKQLNEDNYEEYKNSINNYISCLDDMEDYPSNPFKSLLFEDINFNDKNKVHDDFISLGEQLKTIIYDFNELNSLLRTKVDLSIRNIDSLLHITDLSLNNELYINTLSEFNLSKYDNINLDIIKFIEENNTIKANNPLINFDIKPNIDINNAITDLEEDCNLILRIIKVSKYKKYLNNIIKDGLNINSNNIINIYKDIKKYNLNIEFIKNNYNNINKIIGFNILDNSNNISNIKKVYLNTRDFINLIDSISINENLFDNINCFIDLYNSKNSKVKMYYAIANNNYVEYKTEETKFSNIYKLDLENIANQKDSIGYYNNLISYGSNTDNFEELFKIVKINRSAHELFDLGLKDLITLVKNDNIDYHNMDEILDKSIATGYISLYFEDDDLNHFIPDEFSETLDKYQQYIKDYSKLVVEEVNTKLTNNIIQTLNNLSAKKFKIFKKIVLNNFYAPSIKDIIINYEEIIKKAFPCFFMSPMAVSNYLGINKKGGKGFSNFDLVIFDEASLIPTYEALGAIARGNTLVVAGDLQQMAPSKYYESGLKLKPDQIKYQDASNLLEECIAMGLPRYRLGHHYRSKHESLIRFSNKFFYDNSLSTFTSSDDLRNFIEFKYIESNEEKNRKILSENELNAILDQFKEIYTNPKTMNKSVGIIVFNLNQVEIVSKAIEKLLDKDKELEKKVLEVNEKTKEPYFVKNIETIQGVERDIIILSLNFRKNKEGNAIVRGPITFENGEKRLNVAISRSREKMIVLSTIKYDDFVEDEKIKSKGAKLLKKFIKYITSPFEENIESNKDNDSLSLFIKNDLEKLGYDVSTNVGNSEFKLDLAIKNSTKDKYKLGIIIESDKEIKNISCRDEFYVKETVLNSLNWKTIRINALEYLFDKDAVMEKIVSAIDKTDYKNI